MPPGGYRTPSPINAYQSDILIRSWPPSGYKKNAPAAITMVLTVGRRQKKSISITWNRLTVIDDRSTVIPKRQVSHPTRYDTERYQ